MTGALPARLVAHLAAQDRARADRAEAMLAALTEREQHLVREAAVMGFVQGRVAYDEEPFPKDRTILLRTLLGADSHSHLYPSLAGLARQGVGSSESDSEDSER